jgi:hypothetical protein
MFLPNHTNNWSGLLNSVVFPLFISSVIMLSSNDIVWSLLQMIKIVLPSNNYIEFMCMGQYISIHLAFIESVTICLY